MKQIEVSACNGCKFMNAQNLDYGNINYTCNLAEDFEISIIIDVDITPDWCPLLKESYEIKHKEQK